MGLCVAASAQVQMRLDRGGDEGVADLAGAASPWMTSSHARPV
tara:strand:- start:4711 stop:4839 length:129 start_codon:yes stop_codon:yes gene_type:complete